jgi:hypothetical protein
MTDDKATAKIKADIEKEQAERCPKFYTCDAPLCPLTHQYLGRVWYEDEPVCKQAPYKDNPFVVMQRMLRNKRKRDLEHAYTYKDIIDECKKQGLLKKPGLNVLVGGEFVPASKALKDTVKSIDKALSKKAVKK